MVQLQSIAVLENAHSYLLLLLRETTDIPGTYAANLAADSLVKLRPQPIEAGRIYLSHPKWSLAEVSKN